MGKQVELFYINQLGEEVSTKQKKKNPMVRAQGPGPEGKRCKHCKFFYRKQYAGTYFKCAFRGDTNGPGTDHRANWPACGKFQEDTKT